MTDEKKVPGPDYGSPASRGGQPGHMNTLRNGSHVRRQRLVVGNLPPNMISVQNESRSYRRALEDRVIEVHGEISFNHMHLIDTATAATKHAGICRWLFRNRFDKMTPTDIRQTADAEVKAKKQRDDAVKALELESPPEDPWAGLLVDGLVDKDKDKSDG